MKQIQTFLILATLYHLSPTSKSIPLEEGNRDLPVESESEPEDRRIRRRRPCGRDAAGDGRTFLDWSYSYINVNHNYNYNCGGASGGGGHKPPGGGHRPIGHRPLGGHHQGGGGGGIHGGGGGLLGGGGIHGGGGGIHGGGNSFSGNNGNHNNGGGLFGLGLFDWFGNHRPPSTPKPYQPVEPENPQEPEKPDNPNVDKPVHEDYDDILPEGYQNWKPGQYVSAYNPALGNYVKDITNFNPNRVVKQVNREINKFFRPLYHLLRR